MSTSEPILSKTLVIFDCDGTLVDSEPLCGQALSMALADFGIKFYAEEYLTHHKGVALSTIQQRIAAERGVNIPVGVTPRYREYVRSLFATDLTMVADIESTLAGTAYTTCVASNGPLEKIRQALEATGLIQYFGDRLFSAYDVGAWKPDPDLFLECSRYFSVAPSRCIVVEDSESGLLAARAAKMQCVYFAHHTGQPVSVTPDAVAERAADLPRLIAGLAFDSE